MIGNDQCVRVWDMFKACVCIQTVRHPQEKWGQITSLVWAHLPAPAAGVGSLALCIGSARGTISTIPFSKETVSRHIHQSLTETHLRQHMLGYAIYHHAYHRRGLCS